MIHLPRNLTKGASGEEQEPAEGPAPSPTAREVEASEQAGSRPLPTAASLEGRHDRNTMPGTAEEEGTGTHSPASLRTAVAGSSPSLPAEGLAERMARGQQ